MSFDFANGGVSAGFDCVCETLIAQTSASTLNYFCKGFPFSSMKDSVLSSDS